MNSGFWVGKGKKLAKIELKNRYFAGISFKLKG